MSFSDTMKALADPTRRAILNYLKTGPMTAGEIGDKFDMTGASISNHLSKLKNADLIREKKQKNYIYYSLNASVLEEVMLWIKDLQGEDSHEEDL